MIADVTSLTNNGGLKSLNYLLHLFNCLIDIDSSNFLVASTNIQTRGNSRKWTKNHIVNIRDNNNIQSSCVSHQHF